MSQTLLAGLVCWYPLLNNPRGFRLGLQWVSSFQTLNHGFVCTKILERGSKELHPSSVNMPKIEEGEMGRKIVTYSVVYWTRACKIQYDVNVKVNFHLYI